MKGKTARNFQVEIHLWSRTVSEGQTVGREIAQNLKAMSARPKGPIPVAREPDDDGGGHYYHFKVVLPEPTEAVMRRLNEFSVPQSIRMKAVYGEACGKYVMRPKLADLPGLPVVNRR